jgi:hypothetical protein
LASGEAVAMTQGRRILEEKEEVVENVEEDDDDGDERF